MCGEAGLVCKALIAMFTDVWFQAGVCFIVPFEITLASKCFPAMVAPAMMQLISLERIEKNKSTHMNGLCSL